VEDNLENINPASDPKNRILLKDLRVNREFSKFPIKNTIGDFQNFLHEWISTVETEKVNQEIGQQQIFVARSLNASQRVLYAFYLLDRQISNGGLLQVVLNRSVYLYYFLFTKENVSTIENFDLWGRILYTAFEKSKPIYLEILKAGNDVSWNKTYEKYESEFTNLDELYFKHKKDFWNLFKNFVVNNENDFFIIH
jgi:hypothetical protein